VVKTGVLAVVVDGWPICKSIRRLRTAAAPLTFAGMKLATESLSKDIFRTGSRLTCFNAG